MTKMPRERLEEIIKGDMPGARLVERAPDADPRSVRADAEADSPELDALRRKYLGDSETGSPSDGDEASASEPAPPNDTSGTGEEPNDEGYEDEIVSYAPESPADPLDRGARPKTVVISGKDEKIIGRQG
jgi:hypothetical protein